MTPGLRVNSMVILVGALGGIPLSFLDPFLLDGEKYLFVKTILGGVFFTIMFCYFLDVKHSYNIKLDINQRIYDLTKPYNTFFVVGITIMLSGLVCFLVAIFNSSHLNIPVYLLLLGLSQVIGAYLYVKISNELRKNN